MLVGNVYLNKTHISVDLIRDLQQELIFRLERDKETWSQFFRPIWALKLKGHNQSEHSHMQREKLSKGGFLPEKELAKQCCWCPERRMSNNTVSYWWDCWSNFVPLIINSDLRKNNKNWRKIRNMILSLEKKYFKLKDSSLSERT